MKAARALFVALLSVSVTATAPAQTAAAPTAPAPLPPPASTAAPSAVSAPLDRIAFEFKVPPARGGGVILGTADSVETVGDDEVQLAGDVEIRYRDLVFRAATLRLHRDTMTVEAEGDVVFDQASRRLAAARADFDLATETGTFFNAQAFAPPDQYFSGESITKTGEETFEIRHGVLTSCTGDETPDWSFRISSARVTIGGYAHLKNTAFRVKKLPLLYLPYMIWPAKTERASGFLIPNMGYTDTRGAYAGLAYYQVMGPSADLTLHLDGYAQSYAGAGAELRYKPSEASTGSLVYYYLADRDNSIGEWRARWSHRNDKLPGGFRAVVDFNDYSDYDFFREFQRAENENTRSFLYSNAFLSGSWGAQSLSMIVDQRDTFRSGQEPLTQNQLPEISYRLRKLKLGATPLYLSLESTASYFRNENPGVYTVSYGRVDLSPQLTLPLRVAPWLSIAVSAGGRGTWWGESVPESRVDPTTGVVARYCDGGEVPADQSFCGEPLTSAVPDGNLKIVGPSFSKVFDSPGGRFSRFKHVVEPRFGYGYAGAFDDQNRVARFDELDRFRSTESANVALVNRVLAKPTDETEGGAFEIFSFELSQDYSLVDEAPLQRSSDGLQTSLEGPIDARLRYSPSRTFDLQAKASWSTLFAGLDSTSLSLRAKAKRVGVDLTWYTNYNAELAEKRSDQARIGFDLVVVPERLKFTAQVNYDLFNSELQQQRLFLTYNSQCWDVQLEAREQTTSTYTARDFRFLLNLKNVGTFLDVNGGQDSNR